MSENKPNNNEHTQINGENTVYEIVSAALKVPGVKIDRNAFLVEQFKDYPKETLDQILSDGPVIAGITQQQLHKKAEAILLDGTLKSTAASFAAGLPGGLALAISVPADMIQFYAFSLRIAQQIAYVYGEPDLWSGVTLDEEKVRNQLLLYLGVMLGATGAVQTIRVLSSSLA
ncbi:MAG: bacteriochlorophyll 4-vinyl reductase, partial [Clostridia bacterium]|nr:bacteriochlorophyll 4-vinyl reductase [Clostridia bacterium]